MTRSNSPASSATAVNSDRIQDTLYAFTRSQILFTALDLDVFTHVAAGADTQAALQLRLNVAPRGLGMLLNGLVGIGFLNKQADGAYTLPPDVATFLVKSNEDYLGGMVHHCKRLYDNWGLLKDAVVSGQPVGGAQSLAQLEAFFAELVRGLYVSNYPTARKLAVKLGLGPDSQPLEILDVAGGSAVWSIAMLEQQPESRATVMDLPHVVEVAEGYVRQHGLSERFSYCAGDLEELDLPEAQFDLVMMAHICHALGPVATQRAFQRLAKSLKPGGRLVVVDFVADEHRAQAGWPLVFGVNMLICTPEGDVFTGTEYHQWLQEAGLSQVRLEEIETDVTVIVAQRPG